MSRRNAISEMSCFSDNNSTNSKLLSVKGPPCCLQMSIVCNNLRFFFLFSSSFFARTSFFDIFTVAKKSLSSFLTSELSSEVLAHFQLSNLSLSLKLSNDQSTRSALVQITLFLDIDWTDSVPPLIFTQLSNQANSLSRPRLVNGA